MNASQALASNGATSDLGLKHKVDAGDQAKGTSVGDGWEFTFLCTS